MEELIAILRRDHRHLDSMLGELAEAGEADQGDLLTEIMAAFERHAALEEQYVYPRLGEELGDDDHQEAQAEHELARDGFERLRQMVGQPGFGALVDMVRAGIKHHVKEEERELLPELKRQLERDEWLSISREVGEHHEAS